LSAVPPAASPEATSQPLPPVESLTPDSDFTGFMKPDVDEGLKRRALRTLFQDPQFNVMDGLDIYIDDYSKPDPLPASWLANMTQMARLGAFEEKPEPEEGDRPAENPAVPADTLEAPLETPEKPSAEQGLVLPPSSDTSDTVDRGLAPPPVPE